MHSPNWGTPSRNLGTPSPNLGQYALSTVRFTGAPRTVTEAEVSLLLEGFGLISNVVMTLSGSKKSMTMLVTFAHPDGAAAVLEAARSSRRGELKLGNKVLQVHKRIAAAAAATFF